ncbi:MAG: glycosyltransferase [Planctomycetes bacterium]|jgi:GT2 family glycosyltransferase|nr:glycosyltransferase [Planctomycetota bacterium]
MTTGEELRAVLVNYNSWRECTDAVRSLHRAAPHRADGSAMQMTIVVVDSASPLRDAIAERALEEALESSHGELRRRADNAGYAAAVAAGIADSEAEYLLVGNADIVFAEDAVDHMLAAMRSDPSIAAVMPLGFWDLPCQVRLPADHRPSPWDAASETLARICSRWTERHARRRARTALRLADGGPFVDVTMLSGHCLLLRRACLDGTVFDPRYPLYYEDADLSRRLLHRGHRLVQANAARVVHLHDRSASTEPVLKQQAAASGRARYMRTWHGGFGAALDAIARWCWRRAWVKVRAERQFDCATASTGPRDGWSLVLSRSSERILVLLGPDPWCTLPGIMFASGSEWTPPPELMAAVAGRHVFVRAFDATRPDLPLLGSGRIPPC